MRRVCLLVPLVLLAALLAPPRRAAACTPPPGGLPTFSAAERAWAAAVVLEGTVSAVDGEPFAMQTATVTLHEYFKGGGPATVTISNLGSGALCLSAVSVGLRAIFYTTGDPATGLVAHYLSQFDAYDIPSPELRIKLRRALGPGIALVPVTRQALGNVPLER